MEIDPFKDPLLKTYEPLSCYAKFKKIFKLLDLYALPITFKYKGEKKFYTMYGAVVSLFIILATLALLYSEMSSMYFKTRPPNIQQVSKFYTDRVTGVGTPADFIYGV